MAFTPYYERLGSLSKVGVAKEPTFGVAQAASSFIPDTGITLQPDPGLFSPKVMMGVRNANLFALFGQEKHTGNVDAPMFPTNGIEFFVYGIGTDGGAMATAGVPSFPGFGVSGSNSTALGTLTVAADVGATSVSTSAKPNVGSYIQIDVNSATTSSECRLVATVTGTVSPFTVNFAQPLIFNHASTATVTTVTAPFTHTILELGGNTTEPFPSLTVEKNAGNYQSLQFPGCRVNKYDIKSAATDSETDMTADLVAQSVNILDTPTTSSYVQENPFVFSEVTIVMNGVTLNTATSFSSSIDNGLKPTYTYNASHNLQFLTPTTLAVTGEIGVVWYSYDDPTYGYVKQFLPDYNGTVNNSVANQGAITFTMAHPNENMLIVPNCTVAGTTVTLPAGATNSSLNITAGLVVSVIGGDAVIPSADTIATAVGASPTFTLTTAATTNSNNCTLGLATSPGESPSALLTITLPFNYLSKVTDDIKMEDVIMQTLGYTSFYNLGGATPTFGTAQTGWRSTISATLTNSNPVAY